MLDKDIEINFDTKKLPFEYKLLEYRLIVNKELYDEKVIDFKIFNEMENSLISRLTKIRNEYLLKEVDWMKLWGMCFYCNKIHWLKTIPPNAVQ